MRKIIIFTLILAVITSCKKDKSKVDVSKIDVTVKINRFDIDFYTASDKNLLEVKKKYPLLFPTQVDDSVWVNKINDKDEQELFDETQKVFGDFLDEKHQLKKMFKHIKYYNKNFTAPKVITMLTNIDYDNRVIYADSLLLISLDAYLGATHHFYSNYPQYIRLNNHKNHLIVDVAYQFIKKQLPFNSKRTFIYKMIYEGKRMYLLDMYLPDVSDREKFGVSTEKINWIHANEEQVWKYFIDKKYLYNTDSDLDKRFLDIAPFSKFFLDQDNFSPGRVGVYIGWQIVRAFMKNNNVSLHELIATSEEDIFKKSKYKPRK